MAKRTLRPKHSDEIRTKIQASQLVNRLTNHALGKLELSVSQIKAIEILLRKSVPDLSAVQLSGDPENPIQTVTKVALVGMDDNGANRTP